MIEVNIQFGDDQELQRITLAVEPRIREHILITSEGDPVPKAWLVTKLMHMVYPQQAPKICIRVDLA